jgi:hypothetical protein
MDGGGPIGGFMAGRGELQGQRETNNLIIKIFK